MRLSVRKPDAGQRLIGQAIDVLEQLPQPGTTLAVLGAQTLGDSHGLDHGQPLATLVLQAIAHITGGFEGQSPNDADGQRALWESVGVIGDELSAAVLTLKLRGAGRSLTDRALNLHADHGEPYRLTARQLRLAKPTIALPSDRPVFVCENPAIVAVAAQRLGPRCAPLVCIDGQPKSAARLLLELLLNSNASIVYHGDFDWGGLRIGNLMARRYASSPWRYASSDYRRVAQTANQPLRGRPVDATWDARLRAGMASCGRAIFEEMVVEELLKDLG